jgi:hypothetical protein
MNTQTTFPKYKDYVNELFLTIESELTDLKNLVEIEHYEDSARFNKCVEEFEALQNNDWDYFSTEGNIDIDYECAELSTKIYDLIEKVQSLGKRL